MAISFDAANRARDLLVQVRSTLGEVGDANIGFVAARWSDRSRRTQLGEASRQVGEAAELLRTYGVEGSHYDKIGMAALDRLQKSIDEIRLGDRRVAKLVGRQMHTSYGDPFNRTAHSLYAHLQQAELTALEMPGRPYWKSATDLTSEQWLEFSDALHASAANILRRSDAELTIADRRALDRIGMRSNANALLVGYPSDSMWGVHQLGGSHYTGDPAGKLEDIRAWVANDPTKYLSGPIDGPYRARRVLGAANRILRQVPEQLTGPVAGLRDETVDLVERNLGRMDGSRRDTYGRHPDYAEIGRIRANLPLLSLGSAKAGSGANVPNAVEQLTW